MSRVRRFLLLVALTLALLPASTVSLAAQDTTQIENAEPRDTTTTPPPRVLPIKEHEVPSGPLPPGSRLVFDRDSILWSNAATLSDLLARIPGVYVARAGFVELPEYTVYAGRGGQGIELYWDGLRMEPLGTDTLAIDPAQIPLALLRRVDVEILPSRIRVFLVTERHETLEPRSFIQVGSGILSTARFAGMFQHRWRSGFELVAAADFVGGDGISGQDRSGQTFDLLAKVGWLPTPTVGAEYQLRRQDHDRDPADTEGGVEGIPERRGARTDLLFTMFAGSRPDGLGFRVEGGLGVSAWDPDSGSAIPEQRIRRAYLDTRFLTTTWSVGVRGTVGDARTLRSVEGRIGLVPLPGLVLSGDARWERHEGGRTSRGAHGAAGFYYGPVSLVGEISIADAVAAPALLGDSTQQTADRAIRLGLKTRPLWGHVGVIQRDAFAPSPLVDLPIARLDTAAEATYLVADVYLQPLRPLTLRAWYSDPISGTPANLQPPRHARAAVSFRSKYWRTFRSGTFDILLEAALESWDSGIAGLDEGGLPVPLPAATFSELLIRFQLGSFTGFWNMRNAGNQAAQYVPGMPYPLSGQSFGVKWVFAN